MHATSAKLAKSDFINFVKTTFAYFSNKERILDNPLATINIVRMMGLLPVTKGNFGVTDDYARKLCAIVLKKISEQLPLIFENMNAAKWNVFKDGLAILMSIDILNAENINTEFDAISLLHRIPTDENEQRQIANRVFEGLVLLELPIQRMNWIELMAFVDGEKIRLDCLCLASTFDHIIYCLERAVSLYEINDDLGRSINTILDGKLNNNMNLTSELRNK